MIDSLSFVGTAIREMNGLVPFLGLFYSSRRNPINENMIYSSEQIANSAMNQSEAFPKHGKICE